MLRCTSLLIAISLCFLVVADSHGYDQVSPKSPSDRHDQIEIGRPFAPASHLPPPAGTAILDAQSTVLTNETDRAPIDIASLMRPRVSLSADWLGETDGVGISHFDTSIKFPLYPIFGPPPPFVSTGYSLTRIETPAAIDLPTDLHEFSLGASWMRKFNDRWLARFMVGGAFASDLDNTSSDAWQFRGAAFAIYRPNPQWTFAFGALATGRDDLPVLPAVGAIWEPHEALKINLMMPNPRISVLLATVGERQHWAYLGGGISGGTWAIHRSLSGGHDRVSYGEWRLVAGWESTPIQAPGTFRPTGRTLSAEIGYAFARDFEFDSGAADITLGDTLLLRAALSF